MTIAQREESARGFNRQVEPCTFCEMLGIHIAAMTIGWDSREGSGSAWCQTDLATERREGKTDTWSKLCPAISAPLKMPDLERGLWKLIGQQAKAGDNSRPSPIGWLQIQKLDFQGIARSRTFDINRAIHLIDTRKVEVTNGLDATLSRDLAA